MEHPVLLDKLPDVGINGKMWRLLKDWYEDGSCQVKLARKLSARYRLESGVKQGSVLPPALVLLVMDPLLRQVQASNVGVTGFSLKFAVQVVRGHGRWAWQHVQ